MNAWPFGGPPPALWVLCSLNPRGLANSLNPLDHPWNFTSSMVAKHRLRAVTRADRQACGDGKWVLVKPALHTPGLTAVAANLMCFLGYDRAVRIIRSSRARYRWEWRR